MSPDLFSLYPEIIMRNVTDKGAIKVNVPINNIRYADDTVLMAEDKESFETMLK